jgi:DNA-binding PadR family transcriptional regulator
MNKILCMNETYLRFVALAHALEGSTTQISNIDETAKELLRVIASSHAQDKTMTVTHAMGLTAIASPATIHRKLDDLREAGLIEQSFAGKNRRTKYLSPTKAADEYFAELGKVMHQTLSPVQA